MKKRVDQLAEPRVATPESQVRAVTLSNGCIDEKTYAIDDKFRTGEITPDGVHTTTELVALLEKDSKVGLDAIVWGADSSGKMRPARLTREKFLEHWKKNTRAPVAAAKRIREAVSQRKVKERSGTTFDGGIGPSWTGANLIGDDYVPLIGGPFSKQLYLHDMLRMISLAFFAYNHDPIAKAIVHITRDFTLGRGYRVDSKNEKALALWRAFEEANELQTFMNFIAVELSLYGEVFVWWLPNNDKYISWQDMPGQESPKVILPRLRLMDPSTVWEIITYPEDISRVLAYQQVFPTQYQIYTAQDGGSVVPSAKFVIQQTPSEQVQHYAINRVSNEKRGRSDLYPAFGYLKRLRDSVEYSIAALQKCAAWAIDTTIEGSPADMQAYVQDQQSQPTIAPAGSEFVHTPKIKRIYSANNKTSMSAGNVTAFEWCVNMIMAAVQIPVSYLGFHNQGGSTRASAIVGTEPVAKKFEMRQLVYKNILQGMWDRVMELGGIPDADCEITFAEIIAQDATAKIKNLVLAEEIETISHETMSNGVAQELGLTHYDYDLEQAKIAEEKQKSPDFNQYLIAPLTAKPAGTAGGPPAPKPATGAAPQGDSVEKPSAITKDQKHSLDLSRGM